MNDAVKWNIAEDALTYAMDRIEVGEIKPWLNYSGSSLASEENYRRALTEAISLASLHVKLAGPIGSAFMKTVEEYAAAIMEMIIEDLDGNADIGERLRTARSFTDLHNHVDANEYMIHARVPFDPDDLVAMDFYVAVQDEVTRRLADGTWADDEPTMSRR
jgi:hypothetical protein